MSNTRYVMPWCTKYISMTTQDWIKFKSDLMSNCHFSYMNIVSKEFEALTNKPLYDLYEVNDEAVLIRYYKDKGAIYCHITNETRRQIKKYLHLDSPS